MSRHERFGRIVWWTVVIVLLAIMVAGRIHYSTALYPNL